MTIPNRLILGKVLNYIYNNLKGGITIHKYFIYLYIKVYLINK